MSLARYFGIVTVAALAAFPGLPARAQDSAPDVSGVVGTYADIALAGYRDSLSSAQDLKTAVETMLRTPTEDNMDAAKRAWQTARIAYEQTEVFRFGNPAVDDWQHKVNAWPVDEGFLDYVDDVYKAKASNNPFYTADVIGTGQITIDGKTREIERFTPDIIRDTLDGAGGYATNVASGYHAIEFLLFGQDTEKTEDHMGTRPVTDYDTSGACTNGHCTRRAEYLFAAIDLLISDLQEMVSDWEVTGAARRAVTDDPDKGMAAMLRGIDVLTHSELAGKYLQRALDTHDPEWEMDAFSDYSHVSYLLVARGVVNLYLGNYYSIDGNVISGPSLADLITARNPDLDTEMRVKLSTTMARLRMLLLRVRDGETFDQMIAEGNEEGNAAVQAVITALDDETSTLRKIDDLLGVDAADVLPRASSDGA